ncbi:hypothetical protein [Kitasatospora sp. NPDC002040]|uniref:hypothetical protein n=1 Tax=Kitasatospora sp. NPDC002040 TaxID=3154661 RepID=UPI003316B85D
MSVPAPRWAVVAAHAVPLVTLPSGLWRLGLVTGFPDWYGDRTWVLQAAPFVLLLSLVSEALALLTLGLVRPWGEVVPGWVPLLGGRRVPVLAAVVPAGVGAVLVMVVIGGATVNQLLQPAGPVSDQGESMPHSGPGFWLLLACYLPLLAWGPLLAAVTVAYHRRRRGAGRAAVAQSSDGSAGRSAGRVAGRSVDGSAAGAPARPRAASSSATRAFRRWTSWTASR